MRSEEKYEIIRAERKRRINRMLTIEKLRAWGADTEDGLRRCMNNEAFYLRLAEKAAQDPAYDKLKEATEARDLTAAFEAAHALKGVTANLSLTPLNKPVAEMSDLLKAGTDMDYSAILGQVLAARESFLALLE